MRPVGCPIVNSPRAVCPFAIWLILFFLPFFLPFFSFSSLFLLLNIYDLPCNKYAWNHKEYKSEWLQSSVCEITTYWEKDVYTNKTWRGKCKNKFKWYNVYRDRNQISDCQELGMGGGNCSQRDTRELWGLMERLYCFIVVMVSYLTVYALSKLVELYT